ncbi:MAG TPA: anthranilate synthase component I family protein [Methanomassiliicoccales archaeon]|jgi:anthranilate synthase component 1|nr:anthranilate synthase component I family protein [Methanomassiliicoccales archaeon]
MTGTSEIVYEEVPLRLSPAEAYLRLRAAGEPSFLLESAEGASRTVAYSFLGAAPVSVLRAEDEREGLDKVRRRMALRARQHSPFPFMGGLVGYFSYHLVNGIEEGLSVRKGGFPAYELGEYDSGLIYDHSAFKVYHFHPRDGAGRLPLLEQEGEVEDFQAGELLSATSRESYEAGVEDLHRRISEGEVLQTVLSGHEERRFSGDPFRMYLRLRAINPSPYMFYLDFGERKVLGSSPETLVTVRDRGAVTFPIAGTRPLGTDLRDRMRNRSSMLTDQKERAEHMMLVDLARNDLGKVCEFGSVEVADLMRVEEYSHVQHMVSRVRGILREDRDALDALAAVFPAGTVSGAPKHRAMRLIEMLEERGRGPYAGAVGYVSDSGDLDTAISIRSAFVNGDRMVLQAGAGIVLDSVPEREYQECQGKLAALHSALGLAEGAGP